MATIKSYTDLQQSKVLSKILPLESADMIYTMVNGRCTPFIRIETIEEMDEDDVPCWSLASLLAVLPDELEDNHFLTLDKEGKEYCCCYEDGNGNSFKHKFAANPVDACVAMIENLHELNLL